MEPDIDVDGIPLPALLRAARGSYGRAIAARLAEAGFDDIPRNGAFVLGGMANRGGSVANLVRELGVSKQAASALIDALVMRGYLDRRTDPADRRRLIIDVTVRGRTAAASVRAGVEAVDAELGGMISADELKGLRTGLVALCAIRDRLEDEARAASPEMF
jgi:DNA-binding MarR family transcriptional regulator